MLAKLEAEKAKREAEKDRLAKLEAEKAKREAEKVKHEVKAKAGAKAGEKAASLVVESVSEEEPEVRETHTTKDIIDTFVDIKSFKSKRCKLQTGDSSIRQRSKYPVKHCMGGTRRRNKLCCCM